MSECHVGCATPGWQDYAENRGGNLMVNFEYGRYVFCYRPPLMPTSPDYAGYLEQLARLPGGPAAAVTDFLAPWLADPAAEAASNCWRLKSGGRLCLEPLPDAPVLPLWYAQGTETVEIARFGRDLPEGRQASLGAALWCSHCWPPPPATWTTAAGSSAISPAWTRRPRT